MPLVKNTTTGNNYLVKINTDGDTCSRTAIRSYDKQLGAEGFDAYTRFYIPFNYDPSSHTLWVFVNGLKAVVEQTPTTALQYQEYDYRTVIFGASLQPTDIIEFIVAGSYLNDTEVGSGVGGGLDWSLVSSATNVTNNSGYMSDTNTTGAFTLTLPPIPDEGDTFAVVDAFGTFGTAAVTLDRNGNNIFGLAANYILDRDGMSMQLVFDGIDNWILANSISVPLDWEIVAVNTLAVNGGKYMVDSTVAVRTVTAPSSPSINDEFTVSDYAGTFFTNNVTIIKNGSFIMGVDDNFVLNVNDITVKFVYVDATQGWRSVSISS